jgi:hypothetical protein
MNRKDKIYLWARGLVLPIATLVPFLFTRMEEVSCTGLNMSSFQQVSKYTNEITGECLGVVGPSSVVNISIGIGLLFVIAVSLLRVQQRGREKMRRFIARQFVLSLSIAAATALVYALMRNYSQGENIMLINFSPDGSIASERHAIFGMGISVQSFLLLLGVYLLLPLVRWYKVIFSHHYVAGQKKQELFQ